MKKVITTIAMSTILLTACGVEDKNEEVLFQLNDLADAEVRETLTDERISQVLKEKYPKEEFDEVVSVELSAVTKGSEVLSISRDDKQTHFRTYKRDGKEVVKTWEKSVDSPKDTQYFVDSIFPDVANNKNLAVIGMHQEPGMYLSFFVVGQLEDKEEMRILYDNAFEANEPIYQGEVVVTEDRITVVEDGGPKYHLLINGSSLVRENPSF